jgi:hypothetical protein
MEISFLSRDRGYFYLPSVGLTEPANGRLENFILIFTIFSFVLPERRVIILFPDFSTENPFAATSLTQAGFEGFSSMSAENGGESPRPVATIVKGSGLVRNKPTNTCFCSSFGVQVFKNLKNLISIKLGMFFSSSFVEVLLYE